MSILDQLREQLRTLLDERAQHQAALDGVLAEAEARGDGNLNADETTSFNEHRDAIRGRPDDQDDRGLDGRIDDIQARVEELEDLQRRNDAREALAREIQPTPTPAGQRQARVTNEPLTYRNHGPNSFVADAYAAYTGRAYGAVAERLARHDNEVRAGVHGELRDVGTGAFGGLVVPQYLTDMYAEVLRAGRITSNLTFRPPWEEEGMSLVVPRGTTGTAVAAQSGENTAVQETDYDETDLTVPIRTYSGQQDVSRQSLERGRNVEPIIFNDLTAAYAVSLNTDVVNGAGTNGTHTGILQTSGISTVTATSTSQRAILGYIARAIGEVAGDRFMQPSCIVMHPRRWAWLLDGADTTGRPLVVPRAGGPMNAVGQGDAAAYGYVGEVHGVPTYTDGTIPTTVSTTTTQGATEDRIIVARAMDLLLWEEDTMPRQLRFEETLGGQLTVKVVVYGYSGFTAGWHPEGTAAVVGSGLTTPTYA